MACGFPPFRKSDGRKLSLTGRRSGQRFKRVIIAKRYYSVWDFQSVEDKKPGIPAGIPGFFLSSISS
jgi:hypothetical protein